MTLPLKVFMGNLGKSYVTMACRTREEFLDCTKCAEQHFFGITTHQGAVSAAMARPGIPLVRKINEPAAAWLEMSKVLPRHGAKELELT